MNDPVPITVLETLPPRPRERRPRRILTKRRGPEPDDEKTYDKAEYFVFRVVSVANAAELFDLLCDLAPNPHAAVIRGAPLPNLDLRQAQRRLIYQHRSGEPTILAGQPIGWAAFDLDKSAPAEGIDWRTNSRRAAWSIVRRDLPAWVTEADIVVYWSPSQGFKPHMKLRVFVLLERTLTSDELKALMKPLVVSGECPVDLALYNDAQLHYTATPLFTGDAADPLPGGRHYLFEGARRRAVPPQVSTSFARSIRITGGATGGHVSKNSFTITSITPRTVGGRGGSANARIAAEIDSMGDGEGKCGFHMPWIRALAIFYAQNGPDADPRPLIAKLRRRIIQCGTRDAAYVERETRGMIRQARALATREREMRAVRAALRRAPAASPVLSNQCNMERFR